MYACIDLGSNSFHLLIAHWHDGRHDIVERFSEKVQLGEGLSHSRNISPAAFQRGLDCLIMFRHALDRYPINHLWVVGTNALRIAENAAEFLAAAQQAAGIHIDVVSGVEEAALVYAGVSSALSDADLPRLVLDIGGGSTEIIIGHNQQILQAHSMPVGCVSWRDRWFKSAGSNTEQIAAQVNEATEAARSVFAAVAGQLHETPWAVSYASSGTAKMLSAVCAQRFGQQDATGVSLETLLKLQDELPLLLLDPDFQLPGLKSSRRDLMLPGWSVLTGFMQATAVCNIEFSASALREGMLAYMVRAALAGESPLHVLRAS